ncbi:hypothetical protein C8J57DRAFT_1340673 [Mycena rebaudengoi]|nr:hypothetical protein C8J57DRAFT_1340673 [Mycena rebaudengoi]
MPAFGISSPVYALPRYIAGAPRLRCLALFGSGMSGLDGSVPCVLDSLTCMEMNFGSTLRLARDISLFDMPQLSNLIIHIRGYDTANFLHCTTHNPTIFSSVETLTLIGDDTAPVPSDFSAIFLGHFCSVSLLDLSAVDNGVFHDLMENSEQTFAEKVLPQLSDLVVPMTDPRILQRFVSARMFGMDCRGLRSVRVVG